MAAAAPLCSAVFRCAPLLAKLKGEQIVMSCMYEGLSAVFARWFGRALFCVAGSQCEINNQQHTRRVT